MANQNFARVLVNITRRRADLIVGIGGDVFHEEVEDAGLALQEPEKLKRAVSRFDLGRGRFGGDFWRGRLFRGKAQVGDQVVGQLAPEEKREKCAKSQQDTVQCRFCSKSSG